MTGEGSPGTSRDAIPPEAGHRNGPEVQFVVRHGESPSRREGDTMKSVRRIYQWAMRHGFSLVLAFLAVGYGLSLLDRPATADAQDPEVAALKKVALSDVALSERLIALNKLKAKGGSQAVDALADVAEGKTLPVAAAACA